MIGRVSDLQRTLGDIVGTAHVLTDADVRAPYEVDWTGRWRGQASMVVRPGDTAEVAAVVRACAQADAPITVQGGNTGLAGGAVPSTGAVVVVLTRLTELGEVDPAARQVVVGAGATLAAVQRHASAHGLTVGVDLAPRDTATIGGMVATNAGGIRVVAHGMMRAQVAGVEAVLADGTVLDELAGLTKDNTGYDLAGLLVGSEGTLGLVTRVRLRLVTDPPYRVTALVGLRSVADGVSALPALRNVPGLQAVEWLDGPCIDLLGRHLGLAAPPVGDANGLLLVEAAHTDDPTAQLGEALAGLPDADDAAVAEEPAGRARLWAYRERASEAAAASSGVPVRKMDVTVPLQRLPDFVEQLPERVRAAAPAAHLAQFGHLAEGNVHVQVIGVDDDHAPAAEQAVLSAVVAERGSVSAEHGIGIAKRVWLARSRSPEAVAAMRAVKRALDPHGLLNPGVLLPGESGPTGA